MPAFEEPKDSWGLIKKTNSMAATIYDFTPLKICNCIMLYQTNILYSPLGNVRTTPYNDLISNNKACNLSSNPLNSSFITLLILFISMPKYSCTKMSRRPVIFFHGISE